MKVAWFRNRKPCSKRAVVSLLVLISDAAVGLGEKTRLAGREEERGESQLLGSAEQQG